MTSDAADRLLTALISCRDCSAAVESDAELSAAVRTRDGAVRTLRVLEAEHVAGHPRVVASGTGAASGW